MNRLIVNQIGKKELSRSLYEQMDEKDLQKVCEEKDRQLRMLQFRIQKAEKENKDILSSMQNGNQAVTDFFKVKVQETIQTSQTAVECLLNMNDHIKKLVITLKKTVQTTDESMSDVKSLLDMISDINGQESFSGFQQNEQYNQKFFLQIEKESEKLLEQLSNYCDILNKNCIKSQKDNKWLENKYKQQINSSKDQVQILKIQISQVHKQKQVMKRLLQKNQQQKAEISNKIETIIDSTAEKQLKKMDQNSLITFIKKLLYKTNQEQKSKEQIIKENLRLKSSDLQKYKKILLEVKEVKATSRIGQSYGN